MKKLLLFISALVVCVGLQAQVIPYNENFEGYTVGAYLATSNPTWWTTWTNSPGTGEDATISNAFASSPTKSVKVDGSTDLILKLGNKTSGKYDLKWKMYLQTGYGGYFNIQHFQDPGNEYAYEVYFLAAGTGRLYAGSATPFTFSYPKDTWFDVKNEIDVDNDLVKLYINGTLVHQWPFHYQSDVTTGTNQLGGVDFYAGAVSGETPKYYFDDLTFDYLPTVLYSNGFDTYAVNSYVAVDDPVWFTTWSNAPGSAEDAVVKSDFSHSPSNSALVQGSTDLILKLGNKTSGKYELTWWMYVESGKVGYYNVQHFQDPGTEWAYEVYFLTTGGGTLEVGNITTNFTFPQNTWFEVKNMIDIDADSAKLYINGTWIHTWPFHWQQNYTTGTKQLGGVDFYAGAPAGSTPKYYFDDVYFAQLGASSDPEIVVSPLSLADTLAANSSAVHQLTVSNEGASDLIYQVNVILNNGDGMVITPPVPPAALTHTKTTAALTSTSAQLTNGGGAFPDSPEANVVLHYDGENASAIGWNSPPITVTVAARFPNAMTLPYAGMYLDTVSVYINDLNTTGSNEMTIKVYGMGTTYSPGPILATQTFTPTGSAWEHIALSTPVLVTGQDLWIGYTFTQTDAGIFIPGTDAGPVNLNGDFLSTGVGWSHLSNNALLQYNWNIRGSLNGTPFPQWLSVSPMSDTIAPDGSTVHYVTLNSTGLTPGVYNGVIRILSNDPANPQTDVPVALTVVGQVCDPPTGVTVSGVTSSTANVAWSGAPVVEIDYGPVGHTPGTGTVIPLVTSSPYTLTGLSYATTYHVYVRQDCGSANYSPWVGPVAFTTADQYAATVYPFNVVNGTGYVTHSTYLKKGPWMNCSATVNDTLGKGYVKFDMSSLPLNAIITKATLNYYNFYRNLESATATSIYPLANDPVSAAGDVVYSDCSDGPVLWSGLWNTAPAPTWFASPLNASGLNYLIDQMQSGWAGFGIPRTSTAVFRLSGYNDLTYRPTLQLEYHVVTTPLFTMTPASAAFDPVNLGLQSLPQTFTIKNQGGGSITISGVTIDGANADQFVLTDAATYPKVLGPGVSYKVQIVCKPTSVGNKTATFRITDMEENEYSAPLTGSGYLNGPQNLTATPVIGPYVNLAWDAPLPLCEIRYDDNSAEAAYTLTGTSTTNWRFATKVTIPSNGSLQTIGVLCRAGTLPQNWTSVSLCPELAGLPNVAAPIQSWSTVPVTSTSSVWILKSLTTPLAVTVGQTYWIVVQWPAGSTTGPYVFTDLGSNKGRSFYTSTGATWSNLPGNFFMRAYMTPEGDNSSNTPIELVSGKEVAAMADVPALTVESLPKPGIEQVHVIVPGVTTAAGSTRSFSDYTLHRGTASGTYTLDIPGLSGTTYQDQTTSPTTTYYYMLTANYTNGAVNSNEAVVTTFETCPVPTSLTASGITYTTANLSWNGNGTTEWEIQYGPAGFTLGTGTIITGVTSPSYVLTGLSNGTAYGFYVRSKCAESLYSSWGGPVTFATLCPLYAAPFLQDFESTLFPPICWSRSTGTFQWARVTTASGYGIGTASTRANFYSFSTATPFHLMTLNFDASALYMPKLKFDYAYATYETEVDSLKLYYSTDNGTTWTLLQGLAGGLTGILNTGGAIGTSFIPNATQWATYTTSLPAGTNMVRFTGVSAYGNNLFIDNVRVEATVLPLGLSAQVTDVLCYDDCNGGIDLTVSGGVSPYTYMWSDGSTTQDLSGVCAAQYYVTVTDNVGSVVNGSWTIGTPSALNVTPTIVQETCPGALNGSIDLAVSGGTSPYMFLWSTGATTSGINGLAAGSYDVTVTDAHNCQVLSSYEVTRVSNICQTTTVTGTVTGIQCFSASQTIYVAGVAGAFTVTSTGSASFYAGERIFYYVGTHVMPGGYMLGKIAAGGVGCPGLKQTELPSTTEVAPVGITTDNFSLFPNPTSGNITLVQKSEKLYNNVRIEIYGMNGAKVLNTSMIGEKQHEIITRDLQSGLYFVKIIADDYVETIKLVKTR